MALSAFDDEASGPPGDDALAATLGPAFAWWTELKDHLLAAHGPLTEEWGFAGKSTGWGFRLREPRRVLVYLTPIAGGFLASFVLGDRAVEAARTSDLPAEVIAQIEGARRYAEGRGVRLRSAPPTGCPRSAPWPPSRPPTEPSPDVDPTAESSPAG